MQPKILLACGAALLLTPRLPATAGADFLLLDLSARSLAQSGALGSGPQGLAQIRHNPACLALMRGQETQFTHAEAFGNWTHDWIAWGSPLPAGHLGLDLQWTRLKPSPYYDALGNEAGSLEAGSQALGLAYAGNVAGGLAQLGAGARVFRSQLAEYGNAGLALDLGLHTHTKGHGLSAALVLQNLGTQSAYISEQEPLPFLVKASVSAQDEAASSVGLRVSADALAYADLYRPSEVRMGVELSFFRRLALRAGMKSQGGLLHYSVGGGLELGFGGLSYGFVPDPLLEAWHALTLEWTGWRQKAKGN